MPPDNHVFHGQPSKRGSTAQLEASPAQHDEGKEEEALIVEALNWLTKQFKKLPANYRSILAAFAFIVLGGQVPWIFLGEFGTYIQVGLVLGGIFLLFKGLEGLK